MLITSGMSLSRILIMATATILTAGTFHTGIAGLTSVKQERAEPGVETTGAQKMTRPPKPTKPKKTMRNVTITKDGTVLNGAHVKGSIAIKADNVTIKNTRVDYAGSHSIRIYPQADGTKIRRSTINCRASKTNGIVFGNYYASRVRVNNCRNAFMSSPESPAEVRNSWVDGVPFDSRSGTPAPTAAPAPTASSTPTPTPTASSTPTPTPTATSTPTPTPTSAPVLGARAAAANTGVPAGTRLRATKGMTITTDGTVLDGWRIEGAVTISADNVTIRNSLIRSDTSSYPINVTTGSTGSLIEDVEVDNMGGTGIGVLFSGGSGTVRRANIHSAEDGIRIESDNVTVESSYIHDLQRQPDGHHDTIQIRRGDNITLQGNTLLPYKESTKDPMNAALQIGSLLGDDQISNLRVLGNYMNGGNFTINGGGRGEVDSALYSGNRFGHDFRYAVRGNLDSSIWDATNVWDDTGVRVR